MQTAEETFYTDEQDYTNGDLAALQAIEPSLNSGKAADRPTARSTRTATRSCRPRSPATSFTISKTARRVSVTAHLHRPVGQDGCPTNGNLVVRH